MYDPTGAGTFAFAALLLPLLGTASCGDDADSKGNVAPMAYAHLDLIDDMEDTDAFILAVNGRAGAWQAVNDGTEGATEEPNAGDMGFVMPTLDPPRVNADHSLSRH